MSERQKDKHRRFARNLTNPNPSCLNQRHPIPNCLACMVWQRMASDPEFVYEPTPKKQDDWTKLEVPVTPLSPRGLNPIGWRT